MPGLQVLLVDDEVLARSRLRNLLADCRDPAADVAGEAGNASQALELLRRQRFDLVLLDVRMPATDGLSLAQEIRRLPLPPPVVFVTAHADHAVQAFDLEALDYLTKPVRLARLQQALQKVERQALVRAQAGGALAATESLVIQDRGHLVRLPLSEVIYFKAELKYVTVRTASRSYISDASLSELEERHGAQFLRIHRNALVARRALRALERHDDPEEGEGWAVRLEGIDELLAVSRRQLAAVREALTR
ncbi:LytTR family DNA-binding domain-containing protein [Ramlibacter sp. AN1015]|uniref:LytR/AlgR family response regulator transcription factor n=1 Tax=Ramlibacter sp. AN1015 TaxID=3133428 RepID=UPI0030C04843